MAESPGTTAVFQLGNFITVLELSDQGYREKPLAFILKMNEQLSK